MACFTMAWFSPSTVSLYMGNSSLMAVSASLQGARIGQGRENAKAYLRENPAVCLEVENQVREFYGLKSVDAAEPEAEPAEDPED